jgi:hypothetical protein
MHVVSVHRSRADRILKVAPPEAFHPDWTVRGYIMKLARQPSLADQLSPSAADSTGLSLDDGSRVAVVGGGPAGSLGASRTAGRLAAITVAASSPSRSFKSWQRKASTSPHPSSSVG